MKILAIILIIVNHVVQTLTSVNNEVPYHQYVIDISLATANVRKILLLIFRHFGVWGNSIFFICSAWFLLKNSTFKKKKWFFMVVEIWSISVIILLVTVFLLHYNITTKNIIKSFFPTLFATNWYMTCYLLFYPIHPFLNNIINNMNHTQLFRSSLALAFLYIFLDFIKDDLFFPSALILWLTIYFVVAYMQKYHINDANNIKKQIILFYLNALCFVGLILVTDIGGLRFSFLNDKTLHWINNCNPFLIFMSLSMFNIARNIHFKCKIVNYISGLSLLIYIIHENLILRRYVRPSLWNYIYENFGYQHLIGWVFVLTISIFFFSLFAGWLYSKFMQKAILKASDFLYSKVRKKYLAFEAKFL